MSLGHDSSGLEPIQNLAIYNDPHFAQQHGLRPLPGKEYQLSSLEANTVNQGFVTQQQVQGHKSIKVRKSTLVIFAIIGLLLIGGLVGGLVGGLLSKSKNENSTTSPPPTSTLSQPATVVLSTSSSSPTSTGPGGVTVECPDVNNTNYTVPGTNQVFLRQCDTNRVGSDIEYVEKNSMTDCLSYCASWNSNSASSTRCLSVTWVYQGPQGTYVNYCWIKSSVPDASTYSNMESAILII